MTEGGNERRKECRRKLGNEGKGKRREGQERRNLGGKKRRNV